MLCTVIILGLYVTWIIFITRHVRGNMIWQGGSHHIDLEYWIKKGRGVTCYLQKFQSANISLPSLSLSLPPFLYITNDQSLKHWKILIAFKQWRWEFCSCNDLTRLVIHGCYFTMKIIFFKSHMQPFRFFFIVQLWKY